VTAAEAAGGVRKGRTWTQPYRPLRPVSLLVQLTGLTVTEVFLYRSYGAFDSSFHWAAHFLVGLLSASAVLAAYLLVAARPAPGQVVVILLFHVYAMAPDLLFRIGIPHAQWMNVFLGHVAVHYLPGGDRTWLVLSALAALGYVVLLASWVAARQAEASVGLPPGIGIGGSAVWRPQRDPRTTPLAHVHTPGVDAGPRLVLLHGLSSTGAVWRPVTDDLAARGLACVVPDLLGYGDSLRIGTRFTASDQADAVLQLMDRHGLDRVVLVGHSYGCVVAGTIVEHAPERVARLVLVNPPLFADVARAQQRLGGRSWLARKTLAGAGAANLACGVMCLLRRPLRGLAPHTPAGLPESLDDEVAAEVARGGVAHSYPAYRDGLLAMFATNPLPGMLAAPPVPTAVVLATGDETTPASDLTDIAVDPAVDVVRGDGTHRLPLENPTLLADLLAAPPP